MNGKTILDTAVATIDRADGSVGTLPTVYLSAEEAAMLGQVETFLSRERLIRKLWCKDCGMEREVEVLVEPNQIALLCDHRLLFFSGPVPVERAERPTAAPGLSVLRMTIPDAPLAMADAWLQRKYDRLLKAYGLREALWCLQCEDEGNAAGLRVTVDASHVSLLCRHRHYVFSGLTL